MTTFYLYHRAMRDGADELIAALGPERPVDVLRVAAWFDFYRDACLNHAHGEDSVLWPALRAERPVVAPVVDRMDGEHARLSEALAETGAALHDGRVADARSAAMELRSILVAHVEGEERDAVPPLVEAFRGEALDEVMQRVQQHAGMEGPRLALPFFLAVAEADERSEVLAVMPPQLREAYETKWRDDYTALHAAVA